MPGPLGCQHLPPRDPRMDHLIDENLTDQYCDDCIRVLATLNAVYNELTAESGYQREEFVESLWRNHFLWTTVRENLSRSREELIGDLFS